MSWRNSEQSTKCHPIYSFYPNLPVLRHHHHHPFFFPQCVALVYFVYISWTWATLLSWIMDLQDLLWLNLGGDQQVSCKTSQQEDDSYLCHSQGGVSECRRVRTSLSVSPSRNLLNTCRNFLVDRSKSQCKLKKLSLFFAYLFQLWPFVHQCLSAACIKVCGTDLSFSMVLGFRNPFVFSIFLYNYIHNCTVNKTLNGSDKWGKVNLSTKSWDGHSMSLDKANYFISLKSSCVFLCCC